MVRSLTIAMLFAATAVAAPVPKSPPPDPFGQGYLGVRVTSGTMTLSVVELNTPAANAGMKAGDSLVKVGPIQPQEFEEVRQLIGGMRPGTIIKVTVRRGNDDVQTRIVLGARPANFDQLSGTLPIEPFP